MCIRVAINRTDNANFIQGVYKSFCDEILFLYVTTAPTRRERPTVLNAENSLVLAQLALPHFGFNPDEVTLTFVKMRENTVFRADTPDGPIALRLHRPGYRSLEEVSSESAFIELLAREDFSVVQLVPTVDGAFTAVVSDGKVEVIVDAQRWLEGSQQLGDTEHPGAAGALTPQHFITLGQIAARMHNVAERNSQQHHFVREPWNAEGMVGEHALWGDALTVPGLTSRDAEQLTRVRALMLEVFERLGTSAEVYGYIHADFTPENVLQQGDKLVVIDFDDFGEGWYLFDLATVLFWFLQDEHYDTYRAALLEGYRSERELSAAHEQLIDVFLVARGFTYLGWASTRPETETAAFLIAEILPLVVRLAAGLELQREAYLGTTA